MGMRYRLGLCRTGFVAAAIWSAAAGPGRAQFGGGPPRSPDGGSPRSPHSAYYDKGGIYALALPTAAELAIEAALDRPVRLDLENASFDELTAQLSKEFGFNAALDRKSLTEAGVDSVGKSLNLHVADIALRSALRLLLREQELTFVIEHDSLVITTRERADGSLVTRLYDVHDLVVNEGDAKPHYDTLVDLITSTLSPQSWDEVGGPGTIEWLRIPADRFLVIAQTIDVQEQIAQILSALRAISRETAAVRREENQQRVQPVGPRSAARCRAAPTGAEGGDSLRQLDRDWPLSPPSPAEEAIERALQSEDWYSFSGDMDELIRQLRERFSINVQFDPRSLEEAGLTAESFHVELKPMHGKLSQALERLLGSRELAAVIEGDVLVITTKERADGAMKTRFYDLHELVQRKGQREPDFTGLKKLLETTVVPQSWDEVGGPGSIAPLQAAEARLLVISQTRAAHQQIAETLNSLRRNVRKLSAARTLAPKNNGRKSTADRPARNAGRVYAEPPGWSLPSVHPADAGP